MAKQNKKEGQTSPSSDNITERINFGMPSQPAPTPQEQNDSPIEGRINWNEAMRSDPVTKKNGQTPKNENNNPFFGVQGREKDAKDWDDIYASRQKTLDIDDEKAAYIVNKGLASNLYEAKKKYRSITENINKRAIKNRVGSIDDLDLSADEKAFLDVKLGEKEKADRIGDVLRKRRELESSLHAIKQAAGKTAPEPKPDNTWMGGPGKSIGAEPIATPKTNPNTTPIARQQVPNQQTVTKTAPANVNPNAAPIAPQSKGAKNAVSTGPFNQNVGIPNDPLQPPALDISDMAGGATRTPFKKPLYTGGSHLKDPTAAARQAQAQRTDSKATKIGKSGTTIARNEEQVQWENDSKGMAIGGLAANAYGQAREVRPDEVQGENFRRILQQLEAPTTFDGKEVAIGDIAKHREALKETAMDMVMQRLAMTGRKADVAKIVDDFLFDANNEGNGILDYFGNLFQGKWQAGWMPGVDTYGSEAADGDQVMLDVLNGLKDKWHEADMWEGAKEVYGDKLDAQLFAREKDGYGHSVAADGIVSGAKGFLGWISKDLNNLISQGMRGGQINTIDKMMKGDFKSLPAPMITELKDLVANRVSEEEKAKLSNLFEVDEKGRPQHDYMEVLTPMMAELAGSLIGTRGMGAIKMGGSLNVAGRLVGATTRNAAKIMQRSASIVGRLEAAGTLGKAMETSKPFQKLVKLFEHAGTSRAKSVFGSYGFEDSARMAAMFAVNTVLTNTQNASDDDIIDSVGSGFIFGMTGKAVEQAFLNTFVKFSKFGNALQRNGIDEFKLKDAFAGDEGMAKAAMERLGKIKRDSYLLGNMFANPIQTKVSQTIEGDTDTWLRWTDPQTVSDILFGPAIATAGGLKTKRMLDMHRSEKASFTSDFDHVRLNAEIARDQEAVANAKYGDGNPVIPDVEATDLQETTAPEPVEPAAPAYTAENVGEIIAATEDAERVLRTQKPVEAEPVIAGERTPIFEGETTLAEAWQTIGQEDLLDHQQSMTARALEQRGDTRIVIGETDPGRPAEFRVAADGTKTIVVTPETASNPEALKQALIHEQTHALFYDSIKNNPDLGIALEGMMGDLSKQRWFQRWAQKNPLQWEYFRSNPHEFAAMIYDGQDGLAKEIRKASGLVGRFRGVLDRALGGQDHVDPTSFVRTFDETMRQHEQPVGETRTTEERLIDELETAIQNEDIGRASEIAAALDRYRSTGEVVGEAAQDVLGLYSHLKQAFGVDREKLTDELSRVAFEGHMANLILDLNRVGIKDEAVIGDLIERTRAAVEERGGIGRFDNMSPVKQIAEVRRHWNESLKKMPEVIKQMQELSDIHVEPDTIFETSWFNDTDPELTQAQAKAIIGEDISASEFMRENMKNPKAAKQSFLQRAEKFSENMSDAERAKIMDAARKFANDRILADHNRYPVAALIIDKKNQAVAEVKGLTKDPNNPKKKLTRFVQKPTGALNRMQAIRREMTTNRAGQKPTYITGYMERVAEAMTTGAMARMADGDQLRESRYFDTTEKAAKAFIKSGFFPIPKGVKGNIFLDMRDFRDRIFSALSGEQVAAARDANGNIIRDANGGWVKATGKELLDNQTRFLTNVSKDIDAMNLYHYLNSERSWGAGKIPTNLEGVLSAVDIWSLYDRMAENKPVTMQDLSQIWRADLDRFPEIKKIANENAESFVATANDIISKMREMYTGTDGMTIGKPIHRTDMKGSEKLFSSMQTIAHHLVDFGHVNSKAYSKPGKLAKSNTKYYGVVFGTDYKNIRDTATMDVLLDGKGYPTMDFRDLPADVVQQHKTEYLKRGIHFKEDGTPYIKSMLITDEMAANHPVLQRLVGKDGMMASELWDGATFMINDGLHSFFADVLGKKKEDTGSVKMAYAGDHIYKSDMHLVTMDGYLQNTDPELYQYLSDLKRQGVSALQVSSTIKSKSRDFKRKADANGKMIVYSDEGTPLGIEEPQSNGEIKYKPFTAEEVQARAASGEIMSESIREYDLVGDHGLRFVNVASDNGKTVSPALNIHEHAEASPFFTAGTAIEAETGKSFGDVVMDAMQNVTRSLAKKFVAAAQGRDVVRKAVAAYQEGQPLQEITKADHAKVSRLLELMADRLSNEDGFIGAEIPEAEKQRIIRALRTASLSKTESLPQIIVAMDQQHKWIFRDNKGGKSLADYTVAKYFDRAKRVNTMGAMLKLKPSLMVTADTQRGIDISLEIVEQEARAKYADVEDPALREQMVNLELEQYDAWARELVDQHVDQAGNRFTPMGQGVTISANKLHDLNREIAQENAKRAKKNLPQLPLLKVGSKIILKLNPSDSIESFSPMYITGLTSGDPTAISANNEFLTKVLGRDFDGDDMGIIVENGDFYGDDGIPGSNDFLTMWRALEELGTFKPVTDRSQDPRTFQDVEGNPIPIKAELVNQSHAKGFYEEAMKANDERAVSEGIGPLMTFSRFVHRKKNEFVNGVYEYWDEKRQEGVHVQADPQNQRIADSIYKQMQYDTYTGNWVNPDDIFYGARAKSIAFGGKLYESWYDIPEDLKEQAKEVFRRATNVGKTDSSEGPGRSLVEEISYGGTGKDPYMVIANEWMAADLYKPEGFFNKARSVNTGTAVGKAFNNSGTPFLDLGGDDKPIGNVWRSTFENLIKNYEGKPGKRSPWKNLSQDPAAFARMDPYERQVANAMFAAKLRHAKPVEYGSFPIEGVGTWELSPKGIQFKTKSKTYAPGELIKADGTWADEIVKLTDGNPELLMTREINGDLNIDDVPTPFVAGKTDLGPFKKYLEANPDKVIVVSAKDPSRDLRVREGAGRVIATRFVDTNALKSGGIILTGKSPYIEKDQRKADIANKFIGRGSPESSTAQYAKNFGKKANTGSYNDDDIVFVSVEGARSGRIPLDKEEVAKAVKAKAWIVADNEKDADRDYNVGERELRDFLKESGYEYFEGGMWGPKGATKTPPAARGNVTRYPDLQKDLEQARKQALQYGMRLVLDERLADSVKLDDGSLIAIDYNGETEAKSGIIGGVAAALAKADAAVKGSDPNIKVSQILGTGVLSSKDVVETTPMAYTFWKTDSMGKPYIVKHTEISSVLAGVESTGLRPKMANGEDFRGVLFDQTVRDAEQLLPNRKLRDDGTLEYSNDRDDADTLGMFSPTGKLRADKWGKGNRSRFNRLNDFIGKNILHMTQEELDGLGEIMADFLQQEYPDVNADTMDAMLKAISPEWFARKQAEWSMKQAEPDGEKYIALQKAWYVVQGLDAINDMAKKQNIKLTESNLKRGTYQAVWFKRQSAGDKVNLFATDVRPHQHYEPVGDIVTVRNGQVVNVQPRLVGDTMATETAADMTQFMDVQNLSETWTRFGFTHEHMNGMKDIAKGIVSKYRERVAAMNPDSDIAGGHNPELFAEAYQMLIDEAQEYNIPIQTEAGTTYAPVAMPEINITTDYDGYWQISQNINVKLPDGSSVALNAEDGLPSTSSLMAIAEAYIPDNLERMGRPISGEQRNAMRAAIASGIKAMAVNHQIGNIYRAQAEMMRRHPQMLIEKLNGSEDAFRTSVEHAEQIADRFEATARALASNSLQYHMASMENVNRTDLLLALNEALTSDNVDESGKAIKGLSDVDKAKLAQALSNAGYPTDAKSVNGLLNRYMRRLMNEHEINQTREHLRAPFDLDQVFDDKPDAFTNLADPREGIIYRFLRPGKKMQIDPDITYRSLQDFIEGSWNEQNQYFLEAANRDSQARKALKNAGVEGILANENEFAESNLLDMFTGDRRIYSVNHNLNNITRLANDAYKNEGRKYLTDKETGVLKGTPVFLTAQDHQGMVRNFKGRYLGTVVREVNSVLSKGARDIVKAQEAQKTLSGSEQNPVIREQARDINNRIVPKQKVMTVLYNERGIIEYVDNDLLVGMTTGKAYGTSDKFLERQYNKSLADLKIDGMELDRYLAETPEITALTTATEMDGIKTNYIKSKLNKDVGFFAQVAPDKVPSRIGQIVDTTTKVFSMWGGPWMYLFGKHAAQVAMGTALAGIGMATGIGPSLGLGYAAKGVVSAVASIGVKTIGNFTSPLARGMMVDTALKSKKAVSNMVSSLTGKNQDGQGAMASALMMQRTQNDANFWADLVATEGQANFKDTWGPNHIYAKMKIAQDQARKAGVLFSDNPEAAMRVQKELDNMNAKYGRVEFVSIDGRPMMVSRDKNGNIQGTFKHMKDMNMNAIDLALTFGGKWSDKVFGTATAPLKALNKMRVAWAAVPVTSTEVKGLRGQIAGAEQSWQAKYGRLADPMTNRVVRQAEFFKVYTENILGKYNMRGIDQKTPLGRVLNLFSQYSRNFARQSTVGAWKQLQMANEVISILKEDGQWVDKMANHHGIVLGDNIINTVYGSYNGDKFGLSRKFYTQVGIGAAMAMGKRAVGLMGAVALGMALQAIGIGSEEDTEDIVDTAKIPKDLLRANEWDWTKLGTDDVIRSLNVSSPLSTIVENMVTLSASSLYPIVDEDQLPEGAKEGHLVDVAESASNVASNAGAGFGMSGFTELLGLTSMYLMDQVGLFEEIPTSEIERKATQVASRPLQPIVAPLDMGRKMYEDMQEELDK